MKNLHCTRYKVAFWQIFTTSTKSQMKTSCCCENCTRESMLSNKGMMQHMPNMQKGSTSKIKFACNQAKSKQND